MDKYNLKFSGELLPEHDPERVKKRFAQAFHIDDPARVETFFSGREIILRRNLAKDEVARVFVTLRQIGMVIHTEKVESRDTEPTPTPAPRKRQPGAPNYFDLRPSNRTGETEGSSQTTDNKVNVRLIAAGMALLAFLLVGLRFWNEDQLASGSGLAGISIDPQQQPVVMIGNTLFWHDRAGISTRTLDLSKAELAPVAAFDFFSSGELLVFKNQSSKSQTGALDALVGGSQTQNGSLHRCQSDSKECITIASNLGNIAFLVDRRSNTIILANADSEVLQKLDRDGNILASTARQLNHPLHLLLQEGILYLTQNESDRVVVLKPDQRDFAKELDEIALSVGQSNLSGHIFPGEVVHSNDRWWAVMQSRDGSTAGLYQFSSRWQYENDIALPDGALPGTLHKWVSKILVADAENNQIYRLDSSGQREKNFGSDSTSAELASYGGELSLSRSLQAAILGILFCLTATMLALSILETMRQRIYNAPADDNEAGFDINSQHIQWLTPAAGSDKRLAAIGKLSAGISVIAIVAATILGFNLWELLALGLLSMGGGGLYLATKTARHCHLGVLDNQLIIVDHTQTYRVGSGPKIQHCNNYVMIDDVIVYLGNRFVTQFETAMLQSQFLPLFNTGIKVDRVTLRVKLIQGRHPMLLGTSGMSLAVLLSVLLVALST